MQYYSGMSFDEKSEYNLLVCFQAVHSVWYTDTFLMKHKNSSL